MIRSTSVACMLLLCLSAASAQAESGGRRPNLQVKRIPQRELSSLQMRSAQLGDLGQGQRNKSSQIESVEDSNSASAETDESRLDYIPIPTEYRDIKERVLFKTNIGYGLDSTRLSGRVGQSGFAPGQTVDGQGRAFSEQRQYLLGDAIVGSRGILMPSLNSYFLSRFSFNAGGEAYSASNHVYDADDSQHLLIRAAYAEVDGIGDDPESPLHSLYVRAGRQYRYGASRFVSNFDGLSVAYKHSKVEPSLFVGQRVSLFFEDDPGVVAGVGVKIHGQEIVDYPVDLNLDFLRYDGGAAPARLVLEANGRARLSESSRVYLRGRFVDDGTGGDNASGLGRLGVQLRQSVGRSFLVVADVEKKYASEFAYDFTGNTAVDVVNVGQEFGLAFGKAQGATLLAARINYQLNTKAEVYGIVRKRLVEDKTQGDAFSRPFEELGLAAAGQIGKRLNVSGQYKLRNSELSNASNLPGSAFGDTAGTGISRMHEVSAEARYNFGKKKAHAAFGAYVRIYDIETPYVSLAGDGRGGGRFDVGYWPTSLFRIRASGELAQPSQVMAPELNLLISLRLMLEVSF